MSIKFNTPVSRLLLALGLAAGALGAQAATGYAITAEQETMVQAGMTESQVKDLLGPALARRALPERRRPDLDLPAACRFRLP